MKYLISNNSIASVKPYMGSGGMFPGLVAGETALVSEKLMKDVIARYGFLTYSVQPKVVKQVKEVKEVIKQEQPKEEKTISKVKEVKKPKAATKKVKASKTKK